MSESFSQRLREVADPIWQAQLDHSFVRGIGDGTLDIERFKYWVRQDYLFLIDYARLFAIASARSPDLQAMTRFAGLARETLEVEMDLHRSYAAEFGISAADLESGKKMPATQGYTDFLLRTATLGGYPETYAALLPCMWAFNEIGLALAAGPQPADARYAKWIEMYAAPEFGELAQWCRALVDRTAEDLSPATLRRMESAFVTSSRYELLFWEAAWQQQTWPV